MGQKLALLLMYRSHALERAQEPGLAIGVAALKSQGISCDVFIPCGSAPSLI